MESERGGHVTQRKNSLENLLKIQSLEGNPTNRLDLEIEMSTKCLGGSGETVFGPQFGKH